MPVWDLLLAFLGLYTRREAAFRIFLTFTIRPQSMQYGKLQLVCGRYTTDLPLPGWVCATLVGDSVKPPNTGQPYSIQIERMKPSVSC